MKNRPLVPHGGNDRVYTPFPLAEKIVEHFEPFGACLDPCCGKGAFLKAMQRYGAKNPIHRRGFRCDWCEIDNGRDFLSPKWTQTGWNWIITNPPWGQFRAFLHQAMAVSDNVVFLATINHFTTRARMREIKEAKFRFVEICCVDTPPKPWPQSGFQLAAVHIRRNWFGQVQLTHL